MADICDRSKWYRNLWFPCKDGRRRKKKGHTHTGRIRANWTWSNFDLHPIFFNLGCSYNNPPIFITSQVFCCFRRSQAGNHHFLPKVMWLWINGEVSTVVRHKGLVPLEIQWNPSLDVGKENPFLMGYEEFFKRAFNEEYVLYLHIIHMCIVMNVLFWRYFLKSLLCCVLFGFDHGVVRVGLKQNHNHQSCLTRLVISPAVVCVCSNQGNSDRSCESFRL